MVRVAAKPSRPALRPARQVAAGPLRSLLPPLAALPCGPPLHRGGLARCIRREHSQSPGQRADVGIGPYEGTAEALWHRDQAGGLALPIHFSLFLPLRLGRKMAWAWCRGRCLYRPAPRQRPLAEGAVAAKDRLHCRAQRPPCVKGPNPPQALCTRPSLREAERIQNQGGASVVRTRRPESVSKNLRKREISLAEFRRRSGEIKLKSRFPGTCASEIALYTPKGSTAFRRKPRTFWGAAPFVKKA